MYWNADHCEHSKKKGSVWSGYTRNYMGLFCWLASGLERKNVPALGPNRRLFTTGQRSDWPYSRILIRVKWLSLFDTLQTTTWFFLQSRFPIQAPTVVPSASVNADVLMLRKQGPFQRMCLIRRSRCYYRTKISWREKLVADWKDFGSEPVCVIFFSMCSLVPYVSSSSCTGY